MIEKAKESDVGHLASLAIQMWQAHTPEELEANFLDTMQREMLSFSYAMRVISRWGSPSASCGMTMWRVLTLPLWDIWKEF